MRASVLHRRRPGFLLMEVMLGIAVFALFLSAVGLTLLYGQENTIGAGNRIRGAYYTERTLEAARSIRDGSFSSLIAGTHGVAVAPSGTWALSGTTLTASGYITSLTVSPLASDWLSLTASTKWKHGYNRSGSVLITSEVTDWRGTSPIGNWATLTQQGSYDAGSPEPQFNDIVTFSGSYAIASSQSQAGLYLFNIANLASPQRISTSFSLGTSGYELAVRNSVLYVLTGDATQEIRAYRLTALVSFSSSNLIASYNLPGSAQGRSLAISGDRLYVSATASATPGEKEFYVFDISDDTSIALTGSLDDDGSSAEMIALSGTAAYLASSSDTAEVRVVNVGSGSNPVMLGGYNLSDRTLNGVSIAVAGTSAVLGTQRGTSIQEMVLFDLEQGGVPTPPPGPWYREGSGSLVGIDMDSSRCYAFLAADSGHKALQVVNMHLKASLPEVSSYDSSTGKGRGIFYDIVRDRLFFVTDRGFLIFRPGAAPSAC